MSNDLSYVLLPTIEDRKRPPKFQPWYRERLKMKYPCKMDTRNWKFVKDGLDDFRDGLPPPHEDLIIQPEKGPGPVLISEHRRVKESVKKVNQGLTEYETYYSRALPAAEKRRQTIQKYISLLLDHPLAFFQHFSQVLSPEDYERMTTILEAELSTTGNDDDKSVDEENRDGLSRTTSTPGDGMQETPASEEPTFTVPENSLRDKNAPTEISADLASDPTIQSKGNVTETTSTSNRFGRSGLVVDESGTQWDAEEYERKQKNPYLWYIEKQREKQKSKGPSEDEQAASAMESRLKAVSEQFCSWLYELSGDKNQDIDPAVVRNLFSTAYDTKPSLSVPIKIVQMTRVPVELRDGVQDSMIPDSQKRAASLSPLMTSTVQFKGTKDSSKSVADQQATKYRYGAWYLPKSLWQRTLANEELRDPKIIKAEREDTTRRREEEINARLAPLHGIDAFKEYLQETNCTRLPKLITDVEQYRREHPREYNGPSGENANKKIIKLKFER